MSLGARWLIVGSTKLETLTLENASARAVVVSDVAGEEDVRAITVECELTSAAQRRSADASTPGSALDFEIDAAAIEIGEARAQPVQVHLLQPAVAYRHSVVLQ